jgi:(S)-mandelate dehydrogenase
MVRTNPAYTRRITNIDELRNAARRRLPRIVFDYLEGGAEAEACLKNNRRALDAYRIVPRYLVDVSQPSFAVELFGRTYGRPWGIAPTGLANFIWPGTDQALAHQAARRNIPLVNSTPASTSLETLVREAPDVTWFQIYVASQQSVTDDLMARARDAGVEVLVVTVDIPSPAKRERDLRNGLGFPLNLSWSNVMDFAAHPRWSMAMLMRGVPRFANIERYLETTGHSLSSLNQSLAAFMAKTISASLDWEALERIRSRWGGKLVVKGLLHPNDATRACDLGCDGLVLSNHGGRQLDSAVSPVEMLLEIRAVVGRRAKIVLDSGIRRGSDIVKALALGADFVLLGRAGLYGAGANGSEGVKLAFDVIDDEFFRAMAQIGCNRPDELKNCRLDGDRIFVER